MRISDWSSDVCSSDLPFALYLRIPDIYGRAMQRRSTMKLAGMTSALLALSACAGGNYRPGADAPVRIGPAYTIRGATYVPAAAPAYDALGYASWYGSESGNRTANENGRATVCTSVPN